MRNRPPIGWIAATSLAFALVVAGCGNSPTSNDTGGAGGSGGASSSGGNGAGGNGAGGVSGSGGSTGGHGGASGSAGAAGHGSGGAIGAAGSGGAVGNGGHGGSPAAGGTTGAGGQAGGHGGATGSGGAQGGAGGHAATTLRIMPLGDSTTASICYRSHLWQMLTQNGNTTFDFIGTRHGDPGCSFTGYDQDNEGHAGYIITDLLKAAGTGVRPGGADSSDPYVSDARDLATWFNGHPADIALMHFGTNDVWNNIAASKILMAYSAVLASLRAANPNVRLMVAQITPLDPSGCTSCATGVTTLNAMIPAWASSNATAASPITVVDQYTGFDDATDTKDGVHSNDSGSIKIATNWYNALVPLF
jgi:lysophospholipase L1-like esterase